VPEQDETIVFNNSGLTQQEEIAERISAALAANDYILANMIEISAKKIGAFITMDGHFIRVEIAARCHEKEVPGGYSIMAFEQSKGSQTSNSPRLEGF
tara:strand:- start:945 stop:1238 length:294 start_codon:yes stop_codon:yes gene_type:complete